MRAKPDDGVTRPFRQQLGENAVIDHALDDLVHAVRLGRIERHDGVEFLVHAQGIVGGRDVQRVLDVVGGQVAEDAPAQGQGVFLGLRDEVGGAADRGVHVRAAQLLDVHVLAGDGLDHLRAGEEHEGLLADHDDQVGQGGRIGRAARARAEHHADLRDHARILRIAAEDFGIAAQAAHAFLDARPARIDQADDGRAVAQREVHHAADLVALHLAERAAVDREVLRVDVDGAPVDLAVAGDDALAHVGLGGQSHFVVALVGNERLQLVERAGVEQHIEAFARREFALGVLRGDALVAAALARHFPHAPQFENTGVFLRHTLIP